MKSVSPAPIQTLFRGWWLLVGVALAWLAPLRAHDPGISTAQGTVSNGELELKVGFAPADAQLLIPEAARTEAKWTETEFEAAKTQLEQLAPQLWEARLGERVIAPRETRVELETGDTLNFYFIYPCPPGTPLTLRAQKLGELPSGHRQFVMIADGQGFSIAKKLLSARDGLVEVDPAAAAGAAGAAGGSNEPPPTFWGFVGLGVEHIWMGYDHLLFLFALLIVCRSFRSIVAIISCFTLAHSLTLALATLEWVSLPGRFVEPAIAASIVFVGAENLFRRGQEPPGRWALTFGFGLIHGFGFASVLRDLGVGSDGQGIAMPLFTFNLGVEIGQIAIAAVVLPLVWQLRKREWFVRRGVPILSGLIGAAGLYWLLERTVFG